MLFLPLFFGALATAAPTGSSVVHEKRAVSRIDCHEGQSQRVHPDAILPLRIALTQSNLDKGYDYLMSVSDPRSNNYGKHWTMDQIHAEFAPSEETVEAVKAWLERAGISRDDILESASRGWVGANLPAGQVERLLETEYFEHHDENGNMDVGCDSYNVPAHLSKHIDYIKPGTGISNFQRRVVRRSGEVDESLLPRDAVRNHRRAVHKLSGCGKHITPACLRALYDIPVAKYNNSENALGVFEQLDTYDQEDLNLFFEHFAPNVPQGTHPKLVSLEGAGAPVNVTLGGGESVVDFDIAFSLLYPQSIILYQEKPTYPEGEGWVKEYGVPGPKSNQESFALQYAIFENLLDAVDGSFCTSAEKKAGADCGVTELTQVLSVSYSAAELFMPESALKRACNEYMKLGLKGHTFFYASGDYGPAGHNQDVKYPTNFCVDPKKLDISTTNGTVFNPQFPASCPYVTGVGATQLNAPESVTDPERALHQPTLLGIPESIISFGSSGGFSNYFSTPSYQQSAVDTYLQDHNPGYATYNYTGQDSVGANGGIYALGGRGIPDVSANGAHLVGFTNGKNSHGSFGTSLATPIWASIITMVNQERAAAGKGPVGFINPTLYANTQIFNDITSGFVPGCGTDGFSATTGWDPVTGLGTPNYPALLEVFMNLQ